MSAPRKVRVRPFTRRVKGGKHVRVAGHLRKVRRHHK